ncbi:MAG: hypothetical protein JJE42_04445 [Burkholderiales bacterium]|nr:hypothetical protein [Burkholderiales bacterium]
MAIPSDIPPLRETASGAAQCALDEAAKCLGEKLRAAMAHTPHACQFEACRRIEQVLGRKLTPLFALELVELLLVQGREGHELRAAMVDLLSLTDARQSAELLSRVPGAVSAAEREAEFLASEDRASAQKFAVCGECLARIAPAGGEGEVLTGEAAASLWVHCAQCRCAIGALNRS